MDHAVNPTGKVEEFEVTVTLRASSIEGFAGTAIMSRTDISDISSLDAESQMFLVFAAASGMLRSGIGVAASGGVPIERTMNAAKESFSDVFEADESMWSGDESEGE